MNMGDFDGTVALLQNDGCTIRQVGNFAEYWIGVPGDDEYNVYLGDPHEGEDPDLWYAEIGSQIEGPYETFEDLVIDLFIDV